MTIEWIIVAVAALVVYLAYLGRQETYLDGVQFGCEHMLAKLAEDKIITITKDGDIRRYESTN